MCIIAVAYRVHPSWPLIVAANRDELHARPSKALATWDTAPTVIAGKDLVAGGTWLGVAGNGRFAAVSNVRSAGHSLPTGLSRGKLVLDFLVGSMLPDHEAAAFNPFNMIAIDGEEVQFVSNRPEPRRVRVKAGLHAFSNGAFDDEWPKTRRLKEAMKERLSHASVTPRAFFDDLCADADRDAGAHTIENAIFVRNAIYGTRCSTILAVDHRGDGQIIERRFDPDARMVGETALSFSWPSVTAGRAA